MAKNRKQASLTNVVQYDSNFNLSIGTSTSSSFNSSGSIIAASGFTGSLSGSVFGLGNTVSFSSSVTSRLTNIETKSSSVDISISNINSVTASNIARLSNLESKSSSVDISVSSLNTFSASNANTSLNSKTGSYATTGSNTFIGTTIMSGSTYVTGDFVVYGSSSIQYISASSVSIGTNIVQLNTNQPAVRFAGLAVQDSGSAQGFTGSILWDSCCNRWIYSNPSGIGYSGGIIMNGPRASTLGSETTLTCNYIAKSGGGDHLYDSCIIDDGTTTCIKNNLVGTGTITGTTIYGSTITCSPIGCFTTSCATSFIGGTLSGTTIYGSTTSCSPIGLFSGCVGIGTISPLTTLTVKSTNDNGYALTRPTDATTLHWRLSTTETGGDAYTVRYNTFNNEMIFSNYASGGTGGNIIFRTGLSSGTETERFRINCNGITTFSGNVGVNITSAYVLNPLTVSGNQMFMGTSADGNTNSVIGRIMSQTRNYGAGIAASSFASIEFVTDGTTYYKGGMRFLVNGVDGTSTAPTTALTLASTGVACFAGAVCAQQLIGISSATVNGPIYFQNGGNTYFQQYVGSSCDLVIYNTTNNGMYVYTNSAQRFGIAGNGSAIFACQLCVKSLVTTNGNISQVQNSVRTQTFFAYKFINENSTANFFRITTSGASSTHTQLVASNAGVGWYTSQIYNAGNSSYWGGYIGSGTQVSIAGGSAGYISGVYSDNAGAQNYCVTVANNGTSTQSLVVAYITVTAADGYTIQFTQL